MCPQKPITAPVCAPGFGLPNPIQHYPQQLPPLAASESEKEAYEEGIKAGKREAEDKKNPYPASSEQAKAYEHGYLDGQKIRFEDLF
ncbi:MULTISPECIES: hypothetical protein [unclassified Rhizobium]|uniref:hypothetical protein n=1 Tax=unclassified Rhizobium TaxID=2613769 RepID=UPI000EAA12EF|nr:MULTISPECIES: hypothetical protein [unclassified Rhizobium]AYG70247.1 hypothetical protein CCGE531_27660 [Rhizobium sp. CCGE531]AYG76618.1 hypothetical protein CCGE532_27150 [Rhizobium sp. CCGE532]